MGAKRDWDRTRTPPKSAGLQGGWAIRMDAIPGCFGLPSGIATWRGLYEPAGRFCRWLRGFRRFGLGGRVQWPARFPHTEAGVIVLDAHPPHHHHRRHHYPHHVQGATAYCQSGTTASGEQTRPGVIAQNTMRLFTRIELRHPVFGRRRFTVLDRIGWGSPMDFYAPSCSDATAFGRRTISYRILGGAR